MTEYLILALIEGALLEAKSMKKAVLPFAMVCLLLLSISASYVNMAKAQPIWIELGVPTKPINTPPTIQIISPYQNQTLNSPNIMLSFSVIIPQSWVFYIGISNDTFRQIWGNITSVSFLLDGNQPQNLTIENMNAAYGSSSIENLNFSVPLNLAEGVHTIRLFVSGFTYYVLNPLDNVDVHAMQLASVPVQANTTFSFNVALPAVSPTQSVPEFPALIILPLFAVIILLSIVLVRKRITKKITPYLL